MYQLLNYTSYPKHQPAKPVFVCSPYRGNIWKNRRKALSFSNWISDQGIAPIAPHLLFPQFMDEDTDREQAFAFNRLLIERSDAVWVLAGKLSPGMRYEISYAEQIGKPIYFFHEVKEVQTL